MALINVYPDLLSLPARGTWEAFQRSAYRRHRAYFDGLLATYGQEVFGASGLRGAVETAGPALARVMRSLVSHAGSPAPLVSELVDRCAPLLPGGKPEVYLGTLFFLAPAATLNVNGSPVIAVGLERFAAELGDADAAAPAPPPGFPGRFYYRLADLEEMIPHEACHVARMRALFLPPTPRKLSLKEMVLLEGTALVFADRLVGRETLRTFLPAKVFAEYEAREEQVVRLAARDFEESGMEVFQRYFTSQAAINGYYVGFSLCREYLKRFGEESLSELVALPSDEVLARLGV